MSDVSHQALERDALSGAFSQFYACLALASKGADPADLKLAARARDRFVFLLIRSAPAIVAELMSGDAGASLRRVVGDRRNLDLLLNDPVGKGPIRDSWLALEASDERRLLSGVLGWMPQDFDGLERFLDDPRHDPVLIQYLAWNPKCFDTPDQRQAYVAFAIRLQDYVADAIEASPESIRPILENYVGFLRAGAVYSCDGYLKDYAIAKGRLIRAYVKARFGVSPVERKTPEPVPRDRPIRVALLWNDVDLRTENIVGVASSHLLKQLGFHVISIIYSGGYFAAADSPSRTLAAEVEALSTEILDLTTTSGLATKCERIQAADADLLIVMNNITYGFSEYIALTTLRLARWQAVNFCAVFTTGFPSIDLYFSGEWSERGGDPDDGYTERLVRLPATPLIFEREQSTVTPQVSSSTEYRDRDTATLFVSGANFYKIHPALSDTWARVLAASPGSRLILYPFNPNWDTAYPVSKLLGRFASQMRQRGVDPDRVTVAGPWRSSGAITEILSVADIYLDSFPHSGGLSSLDAMRLGLPVVTLGGITQRENQTADLLRALGLAEHIASTQDEYVAMATRLSGDLGHWARFRAEIMRRLDRAIFFDTERYCRGFADAIRATISR